MGTSHALYFLILILIKLTSSLSNKCQNDSMLSQFNLTTSIPILSQQSVPSKLCLYFAGNQSCVNQINIYNEVQKRYSLFGTIEAEIDRYFEFDTSVISQLLLSGKLNSFPEITSCFKNQSQSSQPFGTSQCSSVIRDVLSPVTSWYKSNFQNKNEINQCIFNWACLSESSYCLLSYPNSAKFKFREGTLSLGSHNQVISWAVNSVKIREFLKPCDIVMELSCQMNYGIQIALEKKPIFLEFMFMRSDLITLENCLMFQKYNALKSDALENEIGAFYTGLFDSNQFPFFYGHTAAQLIGMGLFGTQDSLELDILQVANLAKFEKLNHRSFWSKKMGIFVMIVVFLLWFS